MQLLLSWGLPHDALQYTVADKQNKQAVSWRTCKHDARVAAGSAKDLRPQPLRPQHHPLQRQHAQRHNLIVV
jgi:hypothetical protein